MIRPLRALLAVLFSVSGTGCVQQRPALVLWHSLQGPHERALLTLIDRWNAVNLDHAVIIPERRDAGTQHAAVLAALESSSGTALPDLLLTPPQQASLYNSREALVALDSLIDGPEGFKDNDRVDLFPFVLAAGRDAQGATIGLPLGGAARVMVVNRTWLEEQDQLLPESWLALTRVCERATARSQGCFITQADDAALQEWLLAHGTRVTGANGTPQLDSGEVLNALAPLNDFHIAGQYLSAVSSAQALDEFAAGHAVILFEWSDALSAIDRAARDHAPLEFDVAPIPSIANSPAAIQRAPLFVLPKHAGSDGALAWRFLRWALESAQTADYAMDTSDLPARISVLNDLDATRLPRGYLQLVKNVAGHTLPEPLVSAWPCARDALAAANADLAAGLPLIETLTRAQEATKAALTADCPVR